MRELQHNPIRHATLGPSVSVDLGLRKYMTAIYNKMALGLLLASAAAYATSSIPVLRHMMFKAAPAGSAWAFQLTVPGTCIAMAPLAVLLLSVRPSDRATAFRSSMIYWSVVSLIGASMGVIVLGFTGLSIAATLALSAAAFGSLSLVGYTTKQDLTSFGSFLTVGLVGLVGALALNLLLKSPAMAFVINAAGTLVFAGLIAHDTQRLKAAYPGLSGDKAALEAASNYGALSLFINFLNLFQFLLAMVSGERR